MAALIDTHPRQRWDHNKACPIMSEQAHQETKRVDEEGHAHVKSGPPPELRQAYDTVTGRDLLVSLVDEAQVTRAAHHPRRIALPSPHPHPLHI